MPEESVVTAPPKLRDDLVFSRPSDPEGIGLVVKDPVYGKFFRFGPVESFIVEQLDAKTPLDVVRDRAEARFGGALPSETLNVFLHHLDSNHLLDTSETREKVRKRRGRHGWRMKGSWLYMRFPLGNPDRFVSWLAQRTRLLFT